MWTAIAAATATIANARTGASTHRRAWAAIAAARPATTDVTAVNSARPMRKRRPTTTHSWLHRGRAGRSRPIGHGHGHGHGHGSRLDAERRPATFCISL